MLTYGGGLVLATAASFLAAFFSRFLVRVYENLGAKVVSLLLRLPWLYWLMISKMGCSFTTVSRIYSVSCWEGISRVTTSSFAAFDDIDSLIVLSVRLAEVSLLALIG